MFYSLVPLLLSAMGIFFTPHPVRRSRGYSAAVKSIAVFSSLLALLLILWAPHDNQYLYLFKEDTLSFIFSLLASFIGFIVVVFSTWYVDEKERDYYYTMLLFIGSMIGLVLFNNILLFVVCWELTTLTSFSLIRMRGTDNAVAAANKAWIINQVGGIAMLIAAAHLYFLGVHSFDSFIIEADIIAASLFAFGALTKSAVFPFHPWLPSAMEAYSPVSALLHSAAMVMAGMYLLIRITPLLILYAELRWVLLLLGLLTILASSMKAFAEEDLKRVLAYSTLTNIGMVVTCISFASPFSIAAALFHIVSHALFKASLFLEAGVFEHSLKTRDINGLGGSIDRLPVTTFFFTLSALSAMGIPITLGFLSKFAMYESTLPFISLFLLFGTILALGYYASILGFVLKRGGGRRISEKFTSLLAIAPLSLGSVLLAVYPFPLMDVCSKAVRELFGSDFAFPILVEQSMLYLSVILFMGALLVFSRRKAVTPFRSGEPLRGALQTPSSQLLVIRVFAERVYSMLDVEKAYRASGPAGEFLYNAISSVRKFIEVK